MPDTTYTLTQGQRSNLDSRLQHIQEVLETLKVNCGESEETNIIDHEVGECLILIESLVEN